MDSKNLVVVKPQLRELEWNVDRKENTLKITHGLHQKSIGRNQAGICKKDRLSSGFIDFKNKIFVIFKAISFMGFLLRKISYLFRITLGCLRYI